MEEKKMDQKEFSTCLENTSFAEMMQKMIGQQGIGSLCAEMMKKIMGHQEDGCRLHCTEMMQSMRKKCDGFKEELKKAKEEEGHVRDK